MYLLQTGITESCESVSFTISGYEMADTFIQSGVLSKVDTVTLVMDGAEMARVMGYDNKEYWIVGVVRREMGARLLVVINDGSTHVMEESQFLMDGWGTEGYLRKLELGTS